MEFGNVLFGNEMGTWTGAAFEAPVDGIYIFNLHLLSRYVNRAYRLRAMINNGEEGVDMLLENSAYSSSSNSSGHGHYFQIVRELKVGDILTIKDEYVYSSLYDYTYHKCSTNGQEHSCSYITGRLIKKL